MKQIKQNFFGSWDSDFKKELRILENIQEDMSGSFF